MTRLDAAIRRSNRALLHARALLHRLLDAVRGVAGLPDYARYRNHMRRHHPDAPVLSEPEFHRRAIDARYGASRPRCC